MGIISEVDSTNTSSYNIFFTAVEERQRVGGRGGRDLPL